MATLRVKSLRAKPGTLKQRVRGLAGELVIGTSKFIPAANRLLDRLALQTDLRRQVWSATVLQLFNAIVDGDPRFGIPGTPEDTGFARSAWMIRKIKETPELIEVRISNGASYIVFLEFGSSQQAPKGMVRIALRRFRQMFQRNLRTIPRGR